jgi:hypothetical protein
VATRSDARSPTERIPREEGSGAVQRASGRTDGGSRGLPGRKQQLWTGAKAMEAAGPHLRMQVARAARSPRTPAGDGQGEGGSREVPTTCNALPAREPGSEPNPIPQRPRRPGKPKRARGAPRGTSQTAPQRKPLQGRLTDTNHHGSTGDRPRGSPLGVIFDVSSPMEVSGGDAATPTP